jgi:hypothetical protein
MMRAYQNGISVASSMEPWTARIASRQNFVKDITYLVGANEVVV